MCKHNGDACFSTHQSFQSPGSTFTFLGLDMSSRKLQLWNLHEVKKSHSKLTPKSRTRPNDYNSCSSTFIKAFPELFLPHKFVLSLSKNPLALTLRIRLKISITYFSYVFNVKQIFNDSSSHHHHIDKTFTSQHIQIAVLPNLVNLITFLL